MSKWVFGYGSLLWKVDFEYKSKLIGYVKNYKRQFWLLNDDHRGTSEYPGRVVTLVPMDENENASVLGMAYEIEGRKCEKTFKHLDFREKCGYAKYEVKFHPIESKNSTEITCTCYYTDDENKYYSKIVNDDNLIADHIIRAKGPSGTNLEYFLNVCNAIRNLIKENTTSDDQNEFYIKNEKHLFELEKIIRKKVEERSK